MVPRRCCGSDTPRLRSTPKRRPEPFELAGPDAVTAEEFARLLNPEAIRIRRIPTPLARLLGRVVPTLTPELVDIMTRFLLRTSQ